MSIPISIKPFLPLSINPLYNKREITRNYETICQTKSIKT